MLLKKMNNRGMSLAELIISMAISTIVVLMIIAFISGAFRVFRRTNDEVNLQMEAQTTLNQIANVMMEAKKIDKMDLPDNETRYCIDIDLESDPGSGYALIYKKNDKKLYLVSIDHNSNYLSVLTDENKNLLAEYAEQFSITEDAANPKVKIINIQFQIGGDGVPVTVTKKVKLRNTD